MNQTKSAYKLYNYDEDMLAWPYVDVDVGNPCLQSTTAGDWFQWFLSLSGQM